MGETPSYQEMKAKYDGHPPMRVDGQKIDLISVSKVPAFDHEPRVTAWNSANDEDLSYTLEEFAELVDD